MLSAILSKLNELSEGKEVEDTHSQLKSRRGQCLPYVYGGLSCLVDGSVGEEEHMAGT